MGSWVDLATGWGVTGRDVRSVPDDDPKVQAFVRDAVRKGILEESSQAEWDEVHEVDLVDEDDTPTVVLKTDRPVPENKLQHQAKQKRKAIEARHAERDAELEPDDDPDADPSAVRNITDEQVRNELSSRGLSTNGSPKQLRQRLTKRIEREAEQEAEEDDEDDDES